MRNDSESISEEYKSVSHRELISERVSYEKIYHSATSNIINQRQGLSWLHKFTLLAVACLGIINCYASHLPILPLCLVRTTPGDRRIATILHGYFMYSCTRRVMSCIITLIQVHNLYGLPKSASSSHSPPLTARRVWLCICNLLFVYSIIFHITTVSLSKWRAQTKPSILASCNAISSDRFSQSEWRRKNNIPIVLDLSPPRSAHDRVIVIIPILSWHCNCSQIASGVVARTTHSPRRSFQ